MKTSENDLDREVSHAEAGLVLGLSRRRIGQLIAEGWIETPLTVKSAGRGYVKFLLDENRRRAKSATQSRADVARTREIELRIADRENRLIDREEVVAALREIIEAFASAFAGLPDLVGAGPDLRAKIAADLASMFDRARATLGCRASELRATGAISGSLQQSTDRSSL